MYIQPTHEPRESTTQPRVVALSIRRAGGSVHSPDSKWADFDTGSGVGVSGYHALVIRHYPAGGREPRLWEVWLDHGLRTPWPLLSGAAAWRLQVKLGLRDDILPPEDVLTAEEIRAIPQAADIPLGGGVGDAAWPADLNRYGLVTDEPIPASVMASAQARGEAELAGLPNLREWMLSAPSAVLQQLSLLEPKVATLWAPPDPPSPDGWQRVTYPDGASVPRRQIRPLLAVALPDGRAVVVDWRTTLPDWIAHVGRSCDREVAIAPGCTAWERDRDGTITGPGVALRRSGVASWSDIPPTMPRDVVRALWPQRAQELDATATLSAVWPAP